MISSILNLAQRIGRLKGCEARQEQEAIVWGKPLMPMRGTFAKPLLRVCAFLLTGSLFWEPCLAQLNQESTGAEPKTSNTPRLDTIISDTVEGIWDSAKKVSELRKIREEIGLWDQSVRGFRREHQFTLMLGRVYGRWQVKRFGTQISRQYTDRGTIAKFSYSYHLPIYRFFGYYLGTGFGYWQNTQESQSLKLQSATLIPGVLAGFVVNFDPGVRAFAGVDYYLERWSSLQDRDGEDPETTASVTARVTDLMAGIDVFYRLKWAVRVEYHQRLSDFKGSKGSLVHASNSVISRSDQWIGLGLTYHLL